MTSTTNSSVSLFLTPALWRLELAVSPSLGAYGDQLATADRLAEDAADQPGQRLLLVEHDRALVLPKVLSNGVPVRPSMTTKLKVIFAPFVSFAPVPAWSWRCALVFVEKGAEKVTFGSWPTAPVTVTLARDAVRVAVRARRARDATNASVRRTRSTRRGGKRRDGARPDLSRTGGTPRVPAGLPVPTVAEIVRIGNRRRAMIQLWHYDHRTMESTNPLPFVVRLDDSDEPEDSIHGSCWVVLSRLAPGGPVAAPEAHPRRRPPPPSRRRARPRGAWELRHSRLWPVTAGCCGPSARATAART